jgi:hypothetical protein
MHGHKHCIICGHKLKNREEQGYGRADSRAITMYDKEICGSCVGEIQSLD